MKFAITFGRLHHRIWEEAAVAADRLGFESVWLPEHLVLPVAMAGSPPWRHSAEALDAMAAFAERFIDA